MRFYHMNNATWLNKTHIANVMLTEKFMWKVTPICEMNSISVNHHGTCTGACVSVWIPTERPTPWDGQPVVSFYYYIYIIIIIYIIIGNRLIYFRKKHIWTYSNKIKVPQCSYYDYVCMYVFVYVLSLHPTPLELSIWNLNHEVKM